MCERAVWSAPGLRRALRPLPFGAAVILRSLKTILGARGQSECLLEAQRHSEPWPQSGLVWPFSQLDHRFPII